VWRSSVSIAVSFVIVTEGWGLAMRAPTETPAEPPIGQYVHIRYEDPADAFRLYDPRCAAVAGRVAELILGLLPGVAVEHIGSTAIPGCDGKGVVDLMLLYESGGLDAARRTLDELGFQRHTGPKAHPEERPVRIGSIRHEGEPFRLHVHVIAADAEEVAAQRRFRDALRADPALMAEYVAAKVGALRGGSRIATNTTR